MMKKIHDPTLHDEGVALTFGKLSQCIQLSHVSGLVLPVDGPQAGTRQIGEVTTVAG